MIEYDPDRNGGIDREEEKEQQGKKNLTRLTSRSRSSIMLMLIDDCSPLLVPVTVLVLIARSRS